MKNRHQDRMTDTPSRVRNFPFRSLSIRGGPWALGEPFDPDERQKEQNSCHAGAAILNRP
jgi:hypothetical protein